LMELKGASGARAALALALVLPLDHDHAPHCYVRAVAHGVATPLLEPKLLEDVLGKSCAVMHAYCSDDVHLQASREVWFNWVGLRAQLLTRPAYLQPTVRPRPSDIAGTTVQQRQPRPSSRPPASRFDDLVTNNKHRWDFTPAGDVEHPRIIA